MNKQQASLDQRWADGITLCFRHAVCSVPCRMMVVGELAGDMPRAREEGPRVFFRGLLLNSARAFPVNAITFLSYESLVRALRGG